MRYLVLTDIHANLEALESCLDDAARRHADVALILGDLVGYGADPNAVIDRIRAMNVAAIVRGNHDKVACGLDSAEGFNAIARQAALWTSGVLTAEHRAWLAALAAGPRDVDSMVEICHGSPLDEDAYIFDELDALNALATARRPLCLFGHTHWPVAFETVADGQDGQSHATVAPAQVVLKEGAKYLVNPGAVGQPRDGDPRAAYAIVDTARRLVELYRVSYPVERTQAKILAADLPPALAQRLAVGR